MAAASRYKMIFIRMESCPLRLELLMFNSCSTKLRNFNNF